MDDVLRSTCASLIANCGDWSAMCGVTAGQLHGFWLPDATDLLHVAVAAPDTAGLDMLRSRLPGVRGHRRQLPADDWCLYDGLAITTPARTWVDLAATLPLPDLVAAGDSMLRLGTSYAEVDDVLRRSSGRRGVRRARYALGVLDIRSRSRPESHLRVATLAADLPRFEVNEPVHRDEGGWLAEPDLSLAAAKIALEYQGAEHAELGRMRRDITRSADMRRCGWVVLFYGPSEVFGQPWQVAPELRRLIRVRRPDLLVDVRRPRRRVVTNLSSGRENRDHSNVS